jgi:hypothetical protein
MSPNQRRHYYRIILFIVLVLTKNIWAPLVLLVIGFISYCIVTEIIVDERETKVEKR